MATFRHVGTIHTFREKFIAGMVRNGYDAEFAENCFNQIEGFGEYGFPESHAASFALLVYASAWIKCHYPDVFAAALLNSQPMGFYAPAQIVRDAAEHGVEIRPVDVSYSNWDCTLESSQSPAPCGEAEIASEQRERFRVGGLASKQPPTRPASRANALCRPTSPQGGGDSKAKLHRRHAAMRDDICTTHAM